MEQHHVVKAIMDVSVGASAFVAGWLGWLDHWLPHFVTWGGAIIVAYRLHVAYREWRKEK